MNIPIVILTWPDDEDRGPEAYGFDNKEEREHWVGEACAAADAGDSLLTGATFIITELTKPDPIRR